MRAVLPPLLFGAIAAAAVGPPSLAVDPPSLATNAPQLVTWTVNFNPKISHCDIGAALLSVVYDGQGRILGPTSLPGFIGFELQTTQEFYDSNPFFNLTRAV